MTLRSVAPTTVLIIVLVFLAGCDSQTTPTVDPSIAESRQSVSEVVQSEQEVYEVVEAMPKIVGGLSAVVQRIKYPEIAKNAGLQGRVIVSFVVNKKGGVQDAVVMKSAGDALDEEALRVVRETRFKPGMQDGEPVLVRMSLPINFKLDNS